MHSAFVHINGERSVRIAAHKLVKAMRRNAIARRAARLALDMDRFTSLMGERRVLMEQVKLIRAYRLACLENGYDVA